MDQLYLPEHQTPMNFRTLFKKIKKKKHNLKNAICTDNFFKSMLLTGFVGASDLHNFIVGAGAEDLHQDILVSSNSLHGFVQLLGAVLISWQHESNNDILEIAT